MAIALTDLLKDKTREEVLEDLLTIAKSNGLSTTAWQPGEPVWVILTTFADLLSRFWNGPIVNAIRSGFLDYAPGDWLTLLAWTAYGVLRKKSSSATGAIVIENRGGGFLVLTGGEIRIANGNGKTFTNIGGGTLSPWTGSGPYPTVELSFAADESGSGSATPIGGILAYPTAPVQSPVAGLFARANASAIAGSDAESDENLRTRCRLSTGPLSPASAKSAYAVTALSTLRPDGTSIACTRVQVVNNGYGQMSVYLASETGATPGTDLTEGSDVYLANAAIQEKIVPFGLDANVYGATEVITVVQVQLFVTRSANVSEAEAIADATAALTAWFKRLPPNGFKVTPGAVGYVPHAAVVAEAVKANAAIGSATVLLDGGAADVPLVEGEVAVPLFGIIASVVSQ